ncbi:unnamed protein product [Calicophoron daubneyi]|uniref:AN1-type zinc finger protein 6 n=1 Tax=Calicophoron daubneyi TaxID=300641 RepID=A0AAV2TWM0_CALDB
MEENKQQQQNIPLLCRNGCGFYGSPNFDGLCSKCHRSAHAQQTNAPKPECLGPKAESRLKDSEIERKSPESSAEKPRPCDSPAVASEKVPPVVIKVSSDLSPSEAAASGSDSKVSLSSSHPELQADAEVAAAGLSDHLLGSKEDSKPGSPASTCSSTESNGKKRPRCAICHKRVGLTGFTCRCGGLFCSTHRYSDLHSCTFDYREYGQEEIRRSNPQIVCPKIQKI